MSIELDKFYGTTWTKDRSLVMCMYHVTLAQIEPTYSKPLGRNLVIPVCKLGVQTEHDCSHTQESLEAR
jgi:hypothetical protein